MFIRNLQIAEVLQIAKKNGITEYTFSSKYLLVWYLHRLVLTTPFVYVYSLQSLIYLQMLPRS